MKLNTRQQDGATLRQHLEIVYKRTKVKPNELIQPQIANSVKYLLRLYSDLAQGRQTGMGANPLSAIEIQAWLNLTDRKLSNWELNTLRAMDRAFING